MKTIKVLTLANIKMHKYLLIVGFSCLYLYWGYISYFLMYKHNDVGNSLQLSSFLIQMGMLFFMLLGYQLSRKGIEVSALYQFVSGRIIKIHIFNVGFLLIAGFIFVVSIFCFNFTYYYTVEPSNVFFWEMIPFLINNWLLPFYITGLIGYILGANLSSKFVYVVLLFIWIILSPTNMNFFQNLLINTKLQEGVDWLNNLNLGVYNLNEPYDPFYGFEFDWSKKLGIAIFLLIILIISMISIVQMKKKLLIFIPPLIGVALICYSFMPYDNQREKVNDLNLLADDYFYYSTKHEKPKEKLFDYNIKSMDVNIDNFNTFNVNSKMKITDNSQSKIAFTLYRGFKIKSVNLNSNEEISFTQNGDYTIIDLPKNIKEKPITLNIKYSGIGSVRNPALEDYFYLPSDFGWIPKNNSNLTHFMFNDDVMANSLKGSPTKYSLTYNGRTKPIFVNLQEGNKKYEGSSTGITLISGDLIYQEYDGKDIYLPRSWFTYKDSIEAYLETFEKTLKNYNKVLKTHYKMPDKIILLPSMNVNDTYIYANSSGDSEHMILQINPVKLTQVWSLNTVIPYQIDKVIGKNKEVNNPDQYANWLFFNSLSGDHIAIQSDKETSELKEYQLSLVRSHFKLEKKEKFDEQLKVLEKGLSNETFIKWKQVKDLP